MEMADGTLNLRAAPSLRLPVEGDAKPTPPIDLRDEQEARTGFRPSSMAVGNFTNFRWAPGHCRKAAIAICGPEFKRFLESK
jgi:hypothetical protein